MQQKQEVNKPRVKAPIDDYINERKEHPNYNMIADIGDILKTEIPKDRQVRIYFLVARDNGLTNFFDLS